MAVFVINEWIWHDASGENRQDGQRRALRVMECAAKWKHQLVIMQGSRFDQKAWGLCRQANAVTSRLAAIFANVIRLDSNRCIILKDHDAAVLPPELAAAIKDDDHYLIRAQLSVTGSVLVTTDAPLREIVMRAGLPCMSPEEFMTVYC